MTNSQGKGELLRQLAQSFGNFPTSLGEGELLNDIGIAAAIFATPQYVPSTTGTAATLPRVLANESQTIAVTGGDLYLDAIWLPEGLVVNNINYLIGSTGSTGVEHNWALLANSARKPVAVSADNTATDLTASVVSTYPIATTAAGAATSYVVPTTGLYYVGFMMITTGEGAAQNTLAGYTAAAATANGLVPILCGLSSTSQTTPPSSFTNALTAITASASTRYAYLS
jgi:hypothetical protein